MYGGQFDWGGLLLKSNGGVRRCAQTGRKSVAECKGKSALDCETDTSSRYESRNIVTGKQVPSHEVSQCFPVTKCFPVFPRHDVSQSRYVEVNDEVVHGVPGQRVIKNGDIVSLDLGVEYNGMITDSAISVVCGQGTDEVEEFLLHTKKSLYAGLKVVKNGCTTGDIGFAVEKYLSRYKYGLVS